jgi:transcriptional regulator with XRE-family HTH domain
MMPYLGKGHKKTIAKASNGGKARRITQQYSIEGRLVLTKDIAEATGISIPAARAIFRKAREMEGPVTWERLRMLAQKRSQCE